MAGVARPPCCVIVVAIARQRTRGPVSVVSLRQVESDVAVVRQQRVPHGGLPSAVLYASMHLSVPCQCMVTPESSRRLHECGCLVGVTKNFGFVVFDPPELPRGEELCGLH